MEIVNEPATDEHPPDKTADTLELFFDLVFVFAITQVVYLLAHDLTWGGAARAGVLLGVLWWGWANWTWATNLVDLSPTWRRLVVLAAMAATIVMAHSVTSAFEGDGLWVAVPYLIMTQLASALILEHLRGDEAALRGLLKFAPVSAAGGALLITGAIADTHQEWIWLGALVLTMLASELSGRERWALKPGHFAERHGLIMIIALGEAIIAVGVTLANNDASTPSWSVASYLVLGIVYAMTLYWGYFDRPSGIWERSMAEQPRTTVGQYAVHVYIWTHFPMIVGIVFSAVTMEEVFLHPDAPLDGFVAHILAIGVVCFFGGLSVGAWRANRVLLTHRIVATVISLAVIYGLRGLNGRATIAIVSVAFIISYTTEHLNRRRHAPLSP